MKIFGGFLALTIISLVIFFFNTNSQQKTNNLNEDILKHTTNFIVSSDKFENIVKDNFDSIYNAYSEKEIERSPNLKLFISKLFIVLNEIELYYKPVDFSGINQKSSIFIINQFAKLSGSTIYDYSKTNLIIDRFSFIIKSDTSVSNNLMIKKELDTLYSMNNIPIIGYSIVKEFKQKGNLPDKWKYLEGRLFLYIKKFEQLTLNQ